MLFFIIAAFPYNEVILDLQVKGLKNVDTALVITASGLRIGDILTSEKGKDAIKFLYSTDLFKDIKLQAEREEGGVRVIINLEEYPIVKEIVFAGNKHVKEKDLKELIDYALPSIISDRKLFRLKVKIKEMYREKGFRGTKVRIQREEIEGGMKITMVINEGKRLKLTEIEFRGNSNVPDRTLGKKVKHRGKHWWTFWRDGEIKDSLITEDIKGIQDYYHELGFLDAKVDSYRIESEDSKATLVYFITEGRVYYVGNLSFEGNRTLQNPDKFVKLVEGDRFNLKKFQEGIQKIYEDYTDRGYLYAQVSPDMKYRNDTIDVVIKIQENNRVYVKYINIEGNERTYDKVIRRNLTIYPGELFNREEIINSQKKLFRLGYFEDLGFEMVPEESRDSITLVFKVKEKETGQFNAGIGYSGDVGFTGNISFNIPNFMGRGQAVSFNYERTLVSGETNTPIQNISFSFREPWLFDTPTSVGLSLFSNYRIWEYYTEYRKGLEFSGGRYIGEKRNILLSGSYRYGLTNIKVDTTKYVPQAIIDAAGERHESGITLGLVRDTRDNYMAAKSGSYISFSPKLFGTIFGGDVSYLKTILEVRRFVEFLPDFSLMSRVLIGNIMPIGEDNIPITEKFMLGGSGNWGIRGYRDRSIGPAENGYVIGGNTAFLMNFEIRRSITKQAYALAFFDMGNAYRDFRHANLGELYSGAGIGFRIEIPMMGILGFDFGYGFDREKGGKWEPHFQLGYSL